MSGRTRPGRKRAGTVLSENKRPVYTTRHDGKRVQAGLLDGALFQCDLASSVFPAGTLNFTMDLKVFDEIVEAGCTRIEIIDNDADEYLVCSVDEFRRLAKKKKVKKTSWHLDAAKLQRYDRSGRRIRQGLSRYNTCNVVLTAEALSEVVEAYLQFDAFVFDVETTGEFRKDPHRNEILWLALAGPGRADVIPMGHPIGELLEEARKEREAWYDENNPTKTGKPRKKWRTVNIPAVHAPPPDQLWPSQVFDALKPLFFSDRLKIAHNAKFDLLTVAKYFGEVPPPPYFDTQLAEYLRDSSKTTDRSLGGCLRRHLGVTYDKSLGAEIERYPFRAAAQYAYLDGKWTWLLFREIEPLLERERLAKIFKLEMDVLEVLCAMERRGAYLDVPRLQQAYKDAEERCNRAQVRIYKAVGRELNLNSPKQKQEYLYGDRGWSPVKMTETNQPSTDAESLEALYARHKDPVLKDMLEWAEWDKLRSTYFKVWLEKNIDGWIHTDFVQAHVETSRFSSREPNLQNVPRRGDKAQIVRSLFIAPPGYKLVVADYSQIELRVLAHYTRDKTLMRAFIEGGDPHSETAKLLFRTDEPTDTQRDVGKTANFLVVYGGGAGKLARAAKVSETHARRMLDTHRRTFPRVYAWKDEVVRQCRRAKPPHVKTIMGHVRHLPTIHARDDGLRAYAERQAVNTIIQGSAADIIKLAMVRLHRIMRKEGLRAQLVLTIHDELVVLAPEDEAEQAVICMQEAMVLEDYLRVPLTADAKIVDNWGAK